MLSGRKKSLLYINILEEFLAIVYSYRVGSDDPNRSFSQHCLAAQVGHSGGSRLGAVRGFSPSPPELSAASLPFG